MKIIIAHGSTSIESLHSIIPFVLAVNKTPNWSWSFVNYNFFRLNNLDGDIIIIVRKYHNLSVKINEIAKEILFLKNNFSKVVYFDDSASPTTIRFDIFKYVDQYWKRAVLKEKSLYSKKFYGGRLFSDYYHKNFGINDETPIYSQISEEKIMSKLKIAWNIGIGAYPVHSNSLRNKYYPFIRRTSTALSIFPHIFPREYIIQNYIDEMLCQLRKEVIFQNKEMKFSARFDATPYSNSVGYQRRILDEKIKNNSIFNKGFIQKWDFIKETHSIYSIISPFGWGEVCYRDFEAALGGAFLVKPNMEHIDTWPNIYANGLYFSLDWDLQNFNEIEGIFDNYDGVTHAVNTSRDLYQRSLLRIHERAISLIENLVG